MAIFEAGDTFSKAHHFGYPCVRIQGCTYFLKFMVLDHVKTPTFRGRLDATGGNGQMLRFLGSDLKASSNTFAEEMTWADGWLISPGAVFGSFFGKVVDVLVFLKWRKSRTESCGECLLNGQIPSSRASTTNLKPEKPSVGNPFSTTESSFLRVSCWGFMLGGAWKRAKELGIFQNPHIGI